MAQMKDFEKLKKITGKEKNVLLLTHTDIDALGAYVITKIVYPNAEIRHCGNNEMSRIIKESITDPMINSKYELILICDISCTEADAEIINKAKAKNKVVLLDHHETANYLNNYNWALVQNEIIKDCDRIDEYPNNEGHSCGTSLLYDYFMYNHIIENKYVPALKDLALWIAWYDTWDWVNLFNKEPKTTPCYDISVLLRAYSLEAYEERVYNAIKRGDPIFDHDDEVIVKIEKIKVENTLAKASRYIKTGNIRYDGNFYSIVFCNENHYIQETFDYMKEKYPDYDYYMISCCGTISIRTTKDNVHAGKFAQRCGGGGHQGAAGISIPIKTQMERLAESLNVDLFVDKRI